MVHHTDLVIFGLLEHWLWQWCATYTWLLLSRHQRTETKVSAGLVFVSTSAVFCQVHGYGACEFTCFQQTKHSWLVFLAQFLRCFRMPCFSSLVLLSSTIQHGPRLSGSYLQAEAIKVVQYLHHIKPPQLKPGAIYQTTIGCCCIYQKNCIQFRCAPIPSACHDHLGCSHWW